MELFLNSSVADDQRRALAFQGHTFFYQSAPAAMALCNFALTLLQQAFHPLDPRTAQHSLSVEEFSEILATLKPTFINHPESKRLLANVLLERGCDLDRTYFDVPRLRSSTSDDYLTSGIAYAFHPHRDTWYSAPLSQLNWWLPVYPLPPASGMVLYPRYWEEAISNSSEKYDYGRWIEESRFTASEHLKSDTREQPKAQELLDLSGGIVLNGDPGSTMIFSAAQLHSSSNNRSGQCRFSIDFRTVQIEDLGAGSGAANIDSHCTGSTLGDFLRGSDFKSLPANLVKAFEDPN